MPVHIRSITDGDLRLTLTSGGEIVDNQVAATGEEAARVGIMMLASRDALSFPAKEGIRAALRPTADKAVTTADFCRATALLTPRCSHTMMVACCVRPAGKGEVR